MTTVDSPHNSAKVFDEASLRLRQARAKKRFFDKTDASPDFLIAHVARDIVTRLAMVSRQFNHGIDLFGRTNTMALAMHDVENITTVSRVEIPDFHAKDAKFEIMKSNPDQLDLGNKPIDLVISSFALHWSNDLPGALTVAWGLCFAVSAELSFCETAVS